MGNPASGTLRWNQTEAIDANVVYLGRGGGATGVLNVPAGGTLKLGIGLADPTGKLWIRLSTTSADRLKSAANLDLSVNNPNFTAYIGSDFGIGYSSHGWGTAEGSLSWPPKSVLECRYHGGTGQPVPRLPQKTHDGANAVGVLDALNPAATVNWHLNELNVGKSAFGIGNPASGTLRWNQTEAIDANTVYFGRGGGATGVLDVPAGGTLNLGSAADPTGKLRIRLSTTSGGSVKVRRQFGLVGEQPELHGLHWQRLWHWLQQSRRHGRGQSQAGLQISAECRDHGGTGQPVPRLPQKTHDGANAVGVLDVLNWGRHRQLASERAQRRLMQLAE